MAEARRQEDKAGKRREMREKERESVLTTGAVVFLLPLLKFGEFNVHFLGDVTLQEVDGLLIHLPRTREVGRTLFELRPLGPNPRLRMYDDVLFVDLTPETFGRGQSLCTRGSGL